MVHALRRAVALLVLCGVAGCGGNGTTADPCPNGRIAVAAPASPGMLFPAPGSTGLPTTGQNVTISYDPPNGSLRLVAQGSGAVVNGGPFSPAVSPPPGSPAAVVSALPALAAHTTYTVFVDAVYPPASPCVIGGFAGAMSFNEGTLTTQ